MTRFRHRRSVDDTRSNGLIGLTALALMALLFYVSYNALTGLPAQKHYTVTVAVPAAHGLFPTAEAKIAGLRVGQVLSIETRSPADARPYAELTLQLDRDVAPLRSSTTVSVRTSSVLGANYVDIVPGRGGDEIADRGRLSLTRGRTAPQMADLLDIFENSTARNIQTILESSSAGVAGRGEAFNGTLAAVAALLPPLSRLSRTLAATETGLPAFLQTLDRASAGLARSAPQLSNLTTGAARTFAAFAAHPRDLDQTLAAAPVAVRAATEGLERLQPGLEQTERALTDLRPAADLVPDALRMTNRVLVAGRPALRATPAFARDLRRGLRTLRTVARAFTTDGAIRKATELFDEAGPLISVLADAQVSCNLLAVWADNFQHGFGDVGEAQGPSMLNVQFTMLGANGEVLQNAKPADDLASNYYARNDRTECESGNEPFLGGQQFRNPPTREPGSTRDTSPPTGVRPLAQQAGLLDAEPK